MRRLAVCVMCFVVSACSNTTSREQSASEIPVTTTSADARQHFDKGFVLFENLRVEAADEFRQATTIDPRFALAHAMLGAILPGSDGLKEIGRAVQLSTNLPEAERVYIESMAASARGDAKQAVAAARKLVELRPASARAHGQLGGILQMLARDDAASAAEFQKALEIEPNSGGR